VSLWSPRTIVLLAAAASVLVVLCGSPEVTRSGTAQAADVAKASGTAKVADVAGAAAAILPAGRAVTGVGADKPIGFRLFPASSPWNADVSDLPVHPLSPTYLAAMGLDTGLHPDFGTTWNGAPNGIPYVIVRRGQRRVPISFSYRDESDPGPYPIPRDAPIEGGSASDGDRHIIVLDKDRRLLYEVYDAHYDARHGRWRAGSGAIWDLRVNTVRPDGWTSADAAGLPMLPGLVRYDEVQRGEIRHALRFTVSRTQRAYLYPATHFASSSIDPTLPPMGLRVRLRADYPLDGFSRPVRVILTALKRYGMLVADNGGPWYISGAPDPRWNDDVLHELSRVRGRDFEVVDTGVLEPLRPLIYAGRGTTLWRGGTLRRRATFADPGGGGWTARVSWGDGSQSQTLRVSGDQRLRLVHRYTRPGRHRVTVRVTNAAGVTGSRSFLVTVRRR